MANIKSQLVNNAITTLTSSITNSQTSLIVDDADRFPTEGDFRILIGTEVMLVTAVSGTTFTIIRGDESTSAATHSGSDAVKGIVCAGVLTDFQNEVGIHNNDIVNSIAPRFAVTNPNNGLRMQAGDFTWVNQAGASVVDRQNHILMTAPVGSGTGDNAHCQVISAPTPPYAIICAFTYHSERGGSGLLTAPFPQAGIFFRESSSGRLVSLRFHARAANVYNLQAKRMDSPTSFNADIINLPWQFGEMPIWLRIEDDNTDLKFSTGPNGQDWIEIGSQGRTTWLTGGANQIGWGINAAQVSSSIDFISYMELLHFGLEEL